MTCAHGRWHWQRGKHTTQILSPCYHAAFMLRHCYVCCCTASCRVFAGTLCQRGCLNSLFVLITQLVLGNLESMRQQMRGQGLEEAEERG